LADGLTIANNNLQYKHTRQFGDFVDAHARVFGKITGGDKINTRPIRYSQTICAHGENWLYVAVGLRAPIAFISKTWEQTRLQGDQVEAYAKIRIKIRSTPGAHHEC
jgi:hypothetical protein